MMKLRTLARRLALRLFPRTRSGDRAYAWLAFVAIHRRLPSARQWFNDYAHRVRTSDRMYEELCRNTSDKELVKQFVRETIGDQHNVPTIRVLRSVAEVTEFSFPDSCCVKPTHASGSVLFRRNGSDLDLDTIRSWFSLDYYANTREPNYRGLVPKVIVEPLVFGDENVQDFKIFCHRGTPTVVQVDSDRRGNHRRSLFLPSWEPLPFSIKYPLGSRSIPRPSNLEAMLRAAGQLAKPFEFVRVDFYTNGEQFYVGELTHLHGGGHESFVPRSAERKFSHLFFTTPTHHHRRAQDGRDSI